MAVIPRIIGHTAMTSVTVEGSANRRRRLVVSLEESIQHRNCPLLMTLEYGMHLGGRMRNAHAS
jgi:hypothetical protein